MARRSVKTATYIESYLDHAFLARAIWNFEANNDGHESKAGTMKTWLTSMLIKGARLVGLACLLVILHALIQSEIEQAAKASDIVGRPRPRFPRIVETHEGTESVLDGSGDFATTAVADLAFSKTKDNPDRQVSRDEERPLSDPSAYRCPSNPSDFTAIALLPRPPNCKKRFPSVICIGFENCGTEELSLFMSQHPAIKHATVPFDVSYLNGNIPRGVEWYLDRMPVSSVYQVTVEMTSSYIYDRNIPERMSLFKPEMKFILMVCDPVVRALSEFLDLRATNRTSADALREEGSLRPFVLDGAAEFGSTLMDERGVVSVNRSVVAHGLYAAYLREWLEYFPLEQFLIVDDTAFGDDPLPVLRRVERFAGVSSYFDARRIDSVAKRILCRDLRRSSRWCTAAAADWNGPKETLESHADPQVVDKLRKFYRPHNALLEAMIGKKFSWT